VVAGTTAPEIIPPVTQTQRRTTLPPAAAVPAKLHDERVMKGSDSVPRMVVIQSNVPAHHMSKPKRYSTQRQRPAAEVDTPGDVPYDAPRSDVGPAAAADHTYYGTGEVTCASSSVLVCSDISSSFMASSTRSVAPNIDIILHSGRF